MYSVFKISELLYYNVKNKLVIIKRNVTLSNNVENRKFKIAEYILG